MIYVISPPDFIGRNEKYIAKSLYDNITEEKTFIEGHYKDRFGNYVTPPVAVEHGSFYDDRQWITYLLSLNSILTHKIQNGLITSEDTLVFCDFWHLGLDQVKYALETEGVKPTLVGWVHGASWVEGDMINWPWAVQQELAWLEIYDKIWCASLFFSKGLPEKYKHKVVHTGEPFEPSTITQPVIPMEARKYDVVFPHRLDRDKGVDDFLYLVKMTPELSYLITLANEPDPEVKAMFDLPNVTFSIGKSDEDHWADLANCKSVLSTAIQEGWGYAVLKALAVGCIPVLPNRAVYPELYSKSYLYNSIEDAVNMLRIQIHPPKPIKVLIGGKIVDGIPSIRWELKNGN